MRNLIKKILKESEFEWVDDLISDNEFDYPAAAVYYKFGDTPEFRSIFLEKIVSEFTDLKLVGDRVILETSGWCDFAQLFYEDSRGSDGYINKYLAEKMTCEEDDWWEPYYTSDLVPRREWKRKIWNDMVTPNPQLVEAVLDYIRRKYVSPDDYNPNQLNIFRELPKKIDTIKINGRILDKSYFNELKNNLDELGDLIDDEEDFEDLKHELLWAYGDAYNTAARDEVWKAVNGAITDEFGEGGWKTKEITKPGGGMENRTYMEFDITKNFWSTVLNYYDNCFENCVGRDKEKNIDEIVEECDHCMEFEYSRYLDVYRNLLDDSGDLLHPRFQEWPDDDDVERYYIESVLDRL
jgi:hypothetical protein